ncbi:hypothetical protein K474DRAFT_1711280 [Panus rudis PR-1116 ss-1]|nr:hypothetical protein K474DRAFT_1711280 [Panus rudis PR-1116 ss-1]
MAHSRTVSVGQTAQHSSPHSVKLFWSAKVTGVSTLFAVIVLWAIGSAGTTSVICVLFLWVAFRKPENSGSHSGNDSARSAGIASGQSLASHLSTHAENTANDEKSKVADDARGGVSNETGSIPSFDPVWLEDGNVILRTIDASHRFYRGLLAFHSPVFRDMFSIPQPGENSGELGDCPTVHLHDNGRDLQYFLQVLIGTLQLEDENLSIHVISAVLRMSTKYDASMIRERCILILSRSYPGNLSEWDKIPESKSVGMYKVDVRHFHLANYARETSSLVLLPSALLICCMSSIEEILDGSTLPDGYHVELDPINKRAVLLARQELSHRARTETYEYLLCVPDVEGCIRTKTCRTEKSGKMVWVQEQSTDDWLNPLVSECYTSSLCPKCNNKAKESYRNARAKIWDDLPKIFGLGESWQQLERANTDPV